MLDSIRIDRLTLRVPGLSATKAAELARLIGDRLADTPIRGGGAHIQAMSVQVADAGHRSLDFLASQIVAEVRRQLAGA